MVRLVVQPHDVTDIGPRTTYPSMDLASHMHEVHHVGWADLRALDADEMELLHADDHDNLRRGIRG